MYYRRKGRSRRGIGYRRRFRRITKLVIPEYIKRRIRRLRYDNYRMRKLIGTAIEASGSAPTVKMEMQVPSQATIEARELTGLSEVVDNTGAKRQRFVDEEI